MMLTKADILAVDDRPSLPVQVPEWGGTVHIRSWTGTELAVVLKNTESPDWMVDVVAMSLADEAGERIFKNAADVAELRNRNGTALKRIAEAALEHNGIGADQVEDDRGN